MAPKRLSSLGVIAALAGVLLLSGCDNTPGPLEAEIPTAAPTSPDAGVSGEYLGFDTEEEAIAAAEELYSKYYATFAAFWAGDKSVNPVQFLSGEAYSRALQSAAILEKDGLTIIDDSVPIFLASEPTDGGNVELLVCHVVTAQLFDRDGVEVTPFDRPERQALEVEIHRDSDGELRIQRSDFAEDARC